MALNLRSVSRTEHCLLLCVQVAQSVYVLLLVNLCSTSLGRGWDVSFICASEVAAWEDYAALSLLSVSSNVGGDDFSENGWGCWCRLWQSWSIDEALSRRSRHAEVDTWR